MHCRAPVGPRAKSTQRSVQTLNARSSARNTGAALAERQFNRVDPDNRLVAAELERRRECALTEARAAEAALAEQSASRPASQVAMGKALNSKVVALAGRLPQVWADPATTDAHPRQIAGSRPQSVRDLSRTDGVRSLIHIIRPMPLPPPPPPRLNNIASPCKSVTAIRYLSPRLISETFWQTARPSETRIINGAETALTLFLKNHVVASAECSWWISLPQDRSLDGYCDKLASSETQSGIAGRESVSRCGSMQR